MINPVSLTGKSCETNPTNQTNPTCSTGQDRLLVVDADREMLDEVATVLRAEGFDPLLADSLEAAFEALATHPVDMVLLDIRSLMAKGIDAYEALKTTYPDLPVVVTAHQA